MRTAYVSFIVLFACLQPQGGQDRAKFLGDLTIPDKGWDKPMVTMKVGDLADKLWLARNVGDKDWDGRLLLPEIPSGTGLEAVPIDPDDKKGLGWVMPLGAFKSILPVDILNRSDDIPKDYQVMKLPKLIDASAFGPKDKFVSPQHQAVYWLRFKATKVGTYTIFCRMVERVGDELKPSLEKQKPVYLTVQVVAG